MSPRWILQSRRRAWLGYGLVVGLLLMTTVGLARQELWHNLDAAQEATQRELEMVGALVADALRRSQYRSLDFLLRDWAKANIHLTELRVIGKNNLVLSAYRRDTTSVQALKLSLPIDYSYRGRATLSLTRDLTEVYKFNAGFRNELLLEMALLSGFLGAMLFLLLKRQEQAGALRRHAAALEATNESLRTSEQRFRSVLESMELLGVMLDRDGRIILCNDFLLGLTRWERDEVLQRSWFNIFLPSDVREKTKESVFLKAIQTGYLPAYQEREIVTRLGDRRLIAWNNTVFRDPQGQVVSTASIGEDITERRRAERALEHQSLYDALTDLPNRHLLNDRLAQAILVATRDNSTCALLIFNLDNFREINDTLGHTSGDTLLKQIAPRLRVRLRDGDTLAHLGGDEFAVVLPGAPPVQAERVARNLLEVLEVPLDVGDMKMQINASIGIAQYPQHGQSPAELLQHADVAMYTAKHDRSGYAQYMPERDPNSRAQLTLIGELRQAIEHGELVLHYQPKLRLRERGLLGMEALVRWRHPSRGLIAPDAFIAHAENHGAIKPLTLWVLQAAARQRAEWHALGLEIPIAVNLSPVALRDTAFPDQMLALLDGATEPATWLELEVTETALMENPRLMLERLRVLRARGVRLCIDDFGTGYSSLAYLREFQVDTLKIDRTFIHDLATDENNVMIVHAIVQLAHNLGIEVVAEGVENQVACDRLRVFRCDAAQGYHLARPMPAEECLPWVDELLSAQDRAGGS